jgi:glyoxylase-like metal-dependent hydrolase (beta-lactamase superfamily II)
VLTGATGPAPAPFTDEPAEALASLDRLGELDAEWVLPGHGAPFRGSPADAAARVRAAA